jgi:RNA polymerase sigma-70 factor (ECF subfamily)
LRDRIRVVEDIDHGVSAESERRQRFEVVAADVFEPLQRYLRRRARPADADDAFAEVLMTIWRRLDDAPADQILAWSYGIARRVLANQRRGQSRHLRLVEKMESEPVPTHSPDPADSGPDPELTAALERLTDDDREVLHLWAWEQLEPREIAPVLEISVNAATLRLSRARKKLADSLSRQDSASDGHRWVEGTQESR